MFSGITMKEFMESEHSGIFHVEMVTKNVVLRDPFYAYEG